MRLVRLVPLLLILATAACKSESREKPSTTSASPDEGARRIVLPADSPMLDQIKVAPVALAEMPTVEIRAPAKLHADPNRLAEVELPVSGHILRVLVRVGDAVTQGQPLLEMESPEAAKFQSVYVEARASVAQARAALSKAEADRDRLRDLFEHKAVARKELLNAETEFEERGQALQQALAEEEQARQRLKILRVPPGKFGSIFVLRAPLAGKVLEMNVAPGGFWTESAAPVMTIADLSQVWVTASIPESDISKIRLGASLEVQLTAYPDRSWQVNVSRIADSVDAQTHTVTVWAELDNPDGLLRPEMFGWVRYVESVSQFPVVPTGAIVQSESGPFVYRVVKPGIFEAVPVEVGVRREGQVVARSGLSEGDQIVVDGTMLLKGYGEER